MKSRPNVKQTIPFFMVKSMENSLKFYIDGLGFNLMNKWVPRGRIEWCWLERGGGVLMLQEYRGNKFTDKPLGVEICFQCEDALALYYEFISNGLQPKEPFVGNNLWVTAITDPDEFRLSFSSHTDVKEETTYTEWKQAKL
jgi:lactoylglutathione lyase